MTGAAKGDDRDLVDFFISKGANNWNGYARCSSTRRTSRFGRLLQNKDANPTITVFLKTDFP